MELFSTTTTVVGHSTTWTVNSPFWIVVWFAVILICIVREL